MSISEFFNKYCGKKIDFDGAYGFQCVDLFRQYCHDVVGSPHTGAVKRAKELFTQYDSLPVEKEYFTRIPASDVKYYKTGDVIVWGTGTCGHVAIVVGATPSGLVVFEQDGYAQDGAKFSIRTYGGVLGVLRCEK